MELRRGRPGNFIRAFNLVRVNEAGMVRRTLDESTAKVASAAGALIEKKGSIFNLTHCCEGTLLARKHMDATWSVPRTDASSQLHSLSVRT